MNLRQKLENRTHSKEETVVRPKYPGYEPSLEEGLSSEQAKELLEMGFGNAEVESPTKTTGEILRENLLTYFNLIFVILALCLLLVGDWKNMTFLGVVIINAVIGIVQQLRSRHAIEQLTVLSGSRVSVVRDGTARQLPAQELVQGDIVELSAGNQIPADALVVQGFVRVNEALITGEADPIPKECKEELLSGSFIVSGRCLARLTRVGADSYAAKLTLAAKKNGGSAKKSEMMQSLDRLIRFIGIALVPIGIALFYNQYKVQGIELPTAVASTVAALIGMIPEGLFLLTSMALAVSVIRLARKRTLIREMNAIESLARVDVLCVDKTGTITEPDMTLREWITLDEEEYPRDRIKNIFSAYFQAVGDDNDTARAMKKSFPSKEAPGWSVRQVIAFQSEVKWSAVSFREQGTYVFGAPEFVAGDSLAALEDKISPYTAQGCRVLLLARCDGVSEGHIEGTAVPVALAVLENPVRKNAEQVFGYFAEQGVSIKVISGDNPETVSAVAAQAGIAGADRWVDARELKTAGDISQAVNQYTVFGRVIPEQKQKLIKALQKSGHTVAMTGDGVNDVLALKDADCGIAMASGADAAAQAAQLVLLDSDFAALPQVVQEGRRVINNIQRAASLYLVKNILSFFLAVIALFAAIAYPFVPIQLTLLSSLTIGFPSFVLALEPNHDLVRGHFMQNVLRKAFPGGLSAIVAIIFAELFAYAVDIPLTELSTICVALVAVNGVTVLYYAVQPFNVRRVALIVLSALGMLLSMVLFGELFSLYSLSFVSWLVLAVLSMLVIFIQMVWERFFALCDRMIEKLKDRRLHRADRRKRLWRRRRL